MRANGAIAAPPIREIAMNKSAVFFVPVIMALNAGAPAFGSNKDKRPACNPGTQTAQICRQVPNAMTGAAKMGS